MERDTVWVWIAEKERPGIILEVQPDLVRIAYGTSEPREWARVIVHPDSRQGRAFPLREPTHFYGANTSWELLFQSRKLVEAHDATAAG